MITLELHGFLMKSKAIVSALVKRFYYFALNQFGQSIKKIRTDNGAVFNLTEYTLEKGILHQHSCVETC